MIREIIYLRITKSPFHTYQEAQLLMGWPTVRAGFKGAQGARAPAPPPTNKGPPYQTLHILLLVQSTLM